MAIAPNSVVVQGRRDVTSIVSGPIIISKSILLFNVGPLKYRGFVLI
jgi:hypothetical protein